MDRDFIGKRIQRAVISQMSLEDRLNGSRYEEVLLFESEHLAFGVVVCGIQYFCNTLRKRLVLERLDVFALREKLHIEVYGRFCRPQTQLVDRVDVVAAYIHIVRHRLNGVAIVIIHVKSAVVPVLTDRTAEPDFKGVLYSRRQPNVAFVEPFVGHFELPAVRDLLFENTVIVSDRETARNVIEVGQRFHISGGKSAETAVAETCVRLYRVKIAELETVMLDRFLENVGQPEVEKMVLQRSAEKEFHRHIIDLFGLLLFSSSFEIKSFFGQNVSNRHTNCAVSLRGTRVCERLAEIGLRFHFQNLFDFLCVKFLFHIFSVKKTLQRLAL